MGGCGSSLRLQAIPPGAASCAVCSTALLPRRVLALFPTCLCRTLPPSGVLNLFGGVLVFKRKAEEALEASGLPYVIVRPGGMERPRDDYKLTHNVKLATRDKLFGGQVSRLQVAELVAAAVANPELAENKVLEVVAETAAPMRSYDELLAVHPAGARWWGWDWRRAGAVLTGVDCKRAPRQCAGASETTCHTSQSFALQLPACDCLQHAPLSWNVQRRPRKSVRRPARQRPSWRWRWMQRCSRCNAAADMESYIVASRTIVLLLLAPAAGPGPASYLHCHPSRCCCAAQIAAAEESLSEIRESIKAATSKVGES